MKTSLHQAETRGYANHGWLKSHHTFSFANYYNAERMGFGALRVINDDVVAPSHGFGTHPHNNMEIISVPLKGSLKHKDTMGNDFVIKKGEVQAMSAGTGISHSEYNNSESEHVNFLQIWVMPKEQNIEPNYSQKEFSEDKRKNQFQLVVSPDGRDNSVKINQDAFFSLASLEAGNEIEYNKYLFQNGAYIFLISGEIKINDSDSSRLSKRDGLGVLDFDKLQISATEDAEILLMEVPI